MAQSKNHLAALLALVYLLLAIAAPWLSSAGAIALIGTIACLRWQRRLLGLAGLVLLLDLSGFYYALQWPLTNKALLLAGMGGGIAIALLPRLVQREVDHRPQRHRRGQRMLLRQCLGSRGQEFVVIAVDLVLPVDQQSRGMGMRWPVQKESQCGQ